MDDALRGFLEDHFDKVECSIVRIYDKLDSIGKETNGNTKDIENMKQVIDDKLKGLRISHEACQGNCKGFRESLQTTLTISTEEKIRLSEAKMKNWFYGLAGSGVIAIILFLINKIWGK